MHPNISRSTDIFKRTRSEKQTDSMYEENCLLKQSNFIFMIGILHDLKNEFSCANRGERR